MGVLISFCYYVLLFFAILLAGISFYKITDCFVDVKEYKIFKLVAFVGLVFIVTVIIYVSDIVNVLYALIGYIAIMTICYQGSIIKRISTVMVLYPIVVSISIFCNNFNFILIKSINDKINYLIWNFVLAFFWLGIYLVMKDRILYAKQYINDKTWILIDIICFAPFVSIVLTIIWTGYNEEYKAYIIALACIISNIGIMFLIKYIIKSVKIRLDNQNYKLQYDYYKSLEEKQLEVRKIYHDMNNNLQVIRNYIENNNIKKAKLYFEKIKEKVTSYDNKIFCNNSIVNAVLNNKYDIMIENGIDCDINISIDNLISIDDMDLCSIFSNTIDNAIEASIKIKDVSRRKITIKARLYKGYFSYSITNNKENDILTYRGSIISSKQDKKHHGFGLQNIKDIVDKYNGTVDISYTQNEFSLILISKALKI
ncbi:MAG: GHKL domain-containing protein [Firmicutes bacterium]|nr:GHKL domain-containing protein [Bacillota bacterium]